jgi:hypothetical protein
LDTSLQLSPGNAVALGVAEELSHAYPDLIQKNGSDVIIFWLTATIAPTPGENPTVPVETETPIPPAVRVSDTPEPDKEVTELHNPVITNSPVSPSAAAGRSESSQTLLCAGGMILPLLLAGWAGFVCTKRH